MFIKETLIKKTGKRLLACLTATCIGSFPSPLAGYAAETGSAQEHSGAMGRYIESDVALPESEAGWLVYGLERGEDGTLMMIARSLGDEAICLWESGDLGENWQLSYTLPEECADLYFRQISLWPDGSGAGVGMNVWEEDIEYLYVSFDAKGEARILSFPEEEANSLICMDGGGLVGQEYGGAAYLMDRTDGTVLQELVTQGVEQVGGCGNEILLVTDSQVKRYSMEDGEPLESDLVLEDALFSGGKNYMDTTGFGHPIVFAEDEERRLYYCTNDGIFAHNMGGGVVEQAVDGELCSLSDPNVVPSALEVVDGVFFLACMGGQGTSRILKYTYDPNVSSVPQTEVKVYSLREDKGMRQVIALYQKANPEIYVNYEIGMSGTDGVTVSDALRTLNTDILAGNGPDVLVLDGMSVNTYAGKGLLKDLREILDETKERDGLLDKIAYTWEEGGEVPAVPVRFGVPLEIGTTDVVRQTDGLEALEELAKEPGMLYWLSVLQMPEVLYYMDANRWEKEDHTMDEDALADYVNAVKQIYDNFVDHAGEEERELLRTFAGEYAGYVQEEGTYYGDMKFMGTVLIEDKYRLYNGMLLDMMNYCMLTSAADVLGGYGIDLFRTNGQAVFLPICTVGIFNSAREPEGAESFVKYLLSKEGELANSYCGFPVNRDALRELIYTDPFGGNSGMSFSSENTETGERYELDCVWPGQEALDWLMETAESLDIRAEMEMVQMDVVTGEVRRCLQGEISAEEAVASILQKLNLYLAENGA